VAGFVLGIMSAQIISRDVNYCTHLPSQGSTVARRRGGIGSTGLERKLTLSGICVICGSFLRRNLVSIPS